jgi:GH18 family chitinase
MMTRSILFLTTCTLGFMVGTGLAADKIVVGYYPSWSQSSYTHAQIPYEKITHIAHAFIGPTTSGGLEIPSGFLYPALVQSAHQQGVRVLIALGGWGEYSNRFSPMAADTATRRLFVQNLANFCRQHGYDGADLDW